MKAVLLCNNGSFLWRPQGFSKLFSLFQKLLQPVQPNLRSCQYAVDITSIWKIEEGSKYPLAMFINRLQVSWKWTQEILHDKDLLYRQEYNDPCSWAVVAACWVDKAHSVEQWTKVWPDLWKVCVFQPLHNFFRVSKFFWSFWIPQNAFSGALNELLYPLLLF